MRWTVHCKSILKGRLTFLKKAHRGDIINQYDVARLLAPAFLKTAVTMNTVHGIWPWNLACKLACIWWWAFCTCRGTCSRIQFEYSDWNFASTGKNWSAWVHYPRVTINWISHTNFIGRCHTTICLTHRVREENSLILNPSILYLFLHQMKFKC